MKQLLLSVFTMVLLAGAIGYAQPKIQLKEGTNLDMGNVIVNQKITKKISITNSGTDTLHIKDVRAQCGCTATLLTEKVLAPAKEAELSITFNATNQRPGRVTKHVYVDSDDPQTPTLTIEFHPNVIQLLEVMPNVLSFRDAKVDSAMTKSVTIKNTSMETINILSIENKFEYMTVTLGKMNLAPGDSTELVGVLKTPKAGSYQSSVTLLTDNPNISKVEVKSLMWVNRK